jgi:hypothetical protein
VELAKPGSTGGAQAGGASGISSGADISEPPDGRGMTHVEPGSVSGPDAAASNGKIEITLPDGTLLKIGHDIGVVTLRRVMSVLRR